MPMPPREAKIETSIDNRERRRHTLILDVEGRENGTASGAALVHDISDTGLLIETTCALAVGEVIEVTLAPMGVMEAEIMWDGGQIYGCKFTQENPQAAISAELVEGRFTLTHSVAESVAVDAVIDTPISGILDQVASAAPLSRDGKFWINVALGIWLWIMVGAAVFCLARAPVSMACRSPALASKMRPNCAIP